MGTACLTKAFPAAKIPGYIKLTPDWMEEIRAHFGSDYSSMFFLVGVGSGGSGGGGGGGGCCRGLRVVVHLVQLVTTHLDRATDPSANLTKTTLHRWYQVLLGCIASVFHFSFGAVLFWKQEQQQ